MPRALKDRQLLEAELTLVRHEIATRGRSWLHVEVMRASAATLEWVLAGRVSPGPISGTVIDPTDRRELRREASRAEDLMHNPRLGNPAIDQYDANGVKLRAKGVYETLEWVTGRDYTARGQEDWAILDELADLAAKTA